MSCTQCVEGGVALGGSGVVRDHLGLVEMDEAPPVLRIVSCLLVAGDGVLAVGAEHFGS